MATTHSTDARDAATGAVLALLGTSGRLKFRQAGSVAAPGAVVADCPLSATGFGASSAGTAVANPIGGDTNAAGGVVAAATLETSAGSIKIHCGVAEVGSDINWTGSLTVAPGDTVAVSSLTYTALAA